MARMGRKGPFHKYTTSGTRGAKIGMVPRDQILMWTLLLFWGPGDEFTIGKIPEFCTPCCFAGGKYKRTKRTKLTGEDRASF